MTETNEHTKLKELAKNMLINMGFKLEEIHEEYRVEVNSFIKGRHFVVDVCGINDVRKGRPQKSVAIECGQTPAEKLVNLNLFFDEVYHLPYGLKKLDDFDQIYDDAIKEIENLKIVISQQKLKIRELENTSERLNEFVSSWDSVKTLINVLHKLIFPSYVNYHYDEQTQKLLSLLQEKSTG